MTTEKKLNIAISILQIFAKIETEDRYIRETTADMKQLAEITLKKLQSN